MGALCSLAGAMLFWSVPMPKEELGKQPLVKPRNPDLSGKVMRQMSMDERELPAFIVIPGLCGEKVVLQGEHGSVFEAMYGHKAYVGPGRDKIPALARTGSV